MGSATSGYDTCQAAAICWDVNADTLAGVCCALCSGGPNTPICPPNSACFITNGGVVNVCLQTCDPLVPKCSEEQVCVPDNANQFLCLAASDVLPAGSPCEYVNECELGSMCADAKKSTLVCGQVADLCCTTYCDVEAPDCQDPLACVPYFLIGDAPPGLANLGLCQDPV